MPDATAQLFWTNADGSISSRPIGPRPVTIGGLDLCGVQVPDGAAAVHAVVTGTPDGHVVRRLTRAQPLYVNGGDTEEQALSHGDRIGVGDAELAYANVGGTRPQRLRLTFGLTDTDDRIEVEVGGTRVVIGRDEGDVLVGDDSISSRHLEIENYGPGFMFVRDLDSTNGSALNDAELFDRRPLEAGDQLRLGRVTILVDEGGPDEGEDLPRQRTVVFPGSSVA